LKRFIDLVLLIVALPLALPLSAIVAILVKITSDGPVLYWSNRVGKAEAIFAMPKFRTMRVDTPAVATHLLENPEKWLTSIGPFLRKTSLDELPQLWCLFTGEMTIVGPRPALFNQDDLVALRRERGITALVPGITGWAQVNGRDDLPIPVKVDFEQQYLERQSLLLDLKIIFMTGWRIVRPSGVSH
jgi:O-antigen biosynthesis protein WbqP